MKVFISWSGDRSKAMAFALRDWLPDVLHFVEPWLSESDIDAGERWGFRIAEELEATNFGIICITRDNMNAPWLLFEAGALAKSMQDGRVVPLLLDLDLREISGPLAQFQAKKADCHGVKELLVSVNRHSDSSVPDARLDKHFSNYWREFEIAIGKIQKITTSKHNIRPQPEILEELVTLVRGIDARIKGSD